MCGVAGLIHLHGEPVSPVILKKMTDAISIEAPMLKVNGLRAM